MTNKFTSANLLMPPLAEGETYVGVVSNANGELHHVILPPGDIEAPWEEAMAWAKEQGGDLPDRVEQAMLYANRRDLFERRVYWSNRTDYLASAWCQNFDYGQQFTCYKINKLRARAVRRVPVHAAPAIPEQPGSDARDAARLQLLLSALTGNDQAEAAIRDALTAMFKAELLQDPDWLPTPTQYMDAIDAAMAKGGE